MRLRLLELWRRIRSSFWFLPSLMVLAAIALAFAILYADRSLTGPWQTPPSWLGVAGASSARSLLSTIAGSMITVAGVTFSIVIVALTLASSQFGPRLVVGLMDDRGNQVVLGTFISVFAYCLVVLLHLPGEAGSRLLPQFSVLTGIVLAIVAVGVLIYFFHHISDSMQVGHLVEEAGRTLEASIAKLPDPANGTPQAWPPAGFSQANATVRATFSGYLSTLDRDKLVEVASRFDLRIKVEPKAGDFVLKGRALARVTPAEKMDTKVSAAIHDTFALVRRREESEDLELFVERLAGIAVRGLSPGINDPHTAIAAIHRLASALDRLLDRLPAKTEHHDGDGEARVFIRQPLAAEILERAFGQIRFYGRADATVLEALLFSLKVLSARGRRHWDGLLKEQIDLVAEVARDSLLLEHERKRVEGLCDHARVDL